MISGGICYKFIFHESVKDQDKRKVKKDDHKYIDKDNHHTEVNTFFMIYKKIDLKIKIKLLDCLYRKVLIIVVKSKEL